MGPAILNLTPEQSAKISALQQAHHRKVTLIQDELFKKKTELGSLWASQNPNQATIKALQKELFDLIEQIQQESKALRGEVVKIISQLTKSRGEEAPFPKGS